MPVCGHAEKPHLKPATLARRGDCSNGTASTTIDGTLSNWWTKIVTGILLFAFIALQQAMIAIARRSAVSKAGAKS